jgi:hypothetical protein
MNARQTLVGTEAARQPRFETTREQASQARSEFLSQAIAAIYRSIRGTADKGLGDTAQSFGGVAKDA